VNGLVTRKFLDVGALAAPGVPILSIEGTDAYQLEVSVDESRILQIRNGDAAILHLGAAGEQSVEAKVSEIVPSSDASSRTVVVRIAIPSSVPNVRSGFFGRASFPVGETTAVTVPKASVVHRGQLTAVFVEENGAARMRLIKTGKAVGDRLEVLSGINEGDRLIVNPRPDMTDGAEVRP
jgi:RND family efflux transporter MFP subunit